MTSPLLAQLESGRFTLASERTGAPAQQAPASPIYTQEELLGADSPAQPSPGTGDARGSSNRSSALDSDCLLDSEEAEYLANRVAAGEASEDSLEEAAYLLLSALPSSLDPDAFAIPPPISWAPVAGAPATDRAEEGAVAGGHGVPLRLVARHPDVAWEGDGQLQLLIGAAKRTGDPKDVW
ncbi:unnamed protein product [Cladocopium goreaui]|uniref:Titin n=1 Tax=Cladocopium goreaui TaxID=2562237 RepID=A0A9P1CRI8_9DINO|nr:unnamed protein product [Cladocopium goreaui]